MTDEKVELLACPIGREGCSMIQHSLKPIERVQCVGCGVSAPCAATWNALPRPEGAGELRGALEEAYEAIDAALAIIPRRRNPTTDTQRLFNLIAGLLTIEARARRALPPEEGMRKALEYIAESADRGRHDGKPEDGPAHSDYEMWLTARRALAKP